MFLFHFISFAYSFFTAPTPPLLLGLLLMAEAMNHSRETAAGVRERASESKRGSERACGSNDDGGGTHNKRRHPAPSPGVSYPPAETETETGKHSISYCTTRALGAAGMFTQPHTPPPPPLLTPATPPYPSSAQWPPNTRDTCWMIIDFFWTDNFPSWQLKQVSRF